MKNILYDLRKECHYTQEEVALKLNLTRTNYAKLECKKTSTISSETLNKVAELYNVSVDYLLKNNKEYKEKAGVKIPVLGSIPAGIPVEAVEDIIDYEEIPSSMLSTGEYFGLKVKGTSMQPRIMNGDVVIVRKQESAENGDICVFMVNGYEATLKTIKKTEDGIFLIPYNTEFRELFYSNEDIETLPVRIIGKVVELRAKF